MTATFVLAGSMRIFPNRSYSINDSKINYFLPVRSISHNEYRHYQQKSTLVSESFVKKFGGYLS